MARKTTPFKRRRKNWLGGTATVTDWDGSQRRASNEIDDYKETLAGDMQNFRDTELTNAYEGLTNPMAGLGAGNRILGMTNPFAGMGNPLAGMQTEFENKFEDIGVDTKAAELAQKQFQQNQASQLEAMKTMGMTGGQVQGMANAALQQAATTRADIGGQEREGKIMSAKGAAQVQQMEADAKEKKMKAGFEVDKMIRQGQFDVDKLIGSTQLDIDKTTREGQWKTEMAIRGGEMDLQNLDLQKQQGLMALQAGLVEGTQASKQADKNWGQRTFSDRRLKKNITVIGKSPSGINIYNFEYKNPEFGEGIWQGVMSDEIPQEAVIKHNSGYDMVDYNKIDVDFIKIKN